MIKRYILTQFCEETKLPKQLKNQVLRGIQYTSNQQLGKTNGMSDFFSSIPRGFQVDLAQQMFKTAYSDIPFFQEKSSQFLVDIFPLLLPCKVQQGDYVFQKGSFPNLVYFLTRGRINFIIGDKELNFKTFVAGSYVGESEIFNNCLRLFTLRAEEDSDFLTIERESFNQLLTQYPQVQKQMKKISEKREHFMNIALNQISQFFDIGPNNQFWKGGDTKTNVQRIQERQKSISLHESQNSTDRDESGDSPIAAQELNKFFYNSSMPTPYHDPPSSSSQYLKPKDKNSQILRDIEKFGSPRDNEHIINSEQTTQEQNNNEETKGQSPFTETIFNQEFYKGKDEVEVENRESQSIIHQSKESKHPPVTPLDLTEKENNEFNQKLKQFIKHQTDKDLEEKDQFGEKIDIRVFDEKKNLQLEEHYLEQSDQPQLKQLSNQELESPGSQNMRIIKQFTTQFNEDLEILQSTPTENKIRELVKRNTVHVLQQVDHNNSFMQKISLFGNNNNTPTNKNNMLNNTEKSQQNSNHHSHFEPIEVINEDTHSEQSIQQKTSTPKQSHSKNNPKTHHNQIQSKQFRQSSSLNPEKQQKKNMTKNDMQFLVIESKIEMYNTRIENIILKLEQLTKEIEKNRKQTKLKGFKLAIQKPVLFKQQQFDTIETAIVSQISQIDQDDLDQFISNIDNQLMGEKGKMQ